MRVFPVLLAFFFAVDTYALCTGYGVDGKPKSCRPDKVLSPCTPIFTPEDQLATLCMQQGGTACRCSCHDYICSKKVEWETGASPKK